MPSFSTSKASLRMPFGRNVYLRSTKAIKTVSYTFSTAVMPATLAQTGPPDTFADGTAGQKVLQPGTLLARITSGPEAGKVGPFGGPLATYVAGTPNATNVGLDTAANIVGFCDTFLPWQLLERDVEVAVVYDAAVTQGWCMEYIFPTSSVPSGAVPLSDATRDLVIAQPATRSIIFF